MNKKRGISSVQNKELDLELIEKCGSLKVSGSKKLVGIIALNQIVETEKIIKSFEKVSNLSYYSDQMGLI